MLRVIVVLTSLGAAFVSLQGCGGGSSPTPSPPPPSPSPQCPPKASPLALSPAAPIVPAPFQSSDGNASSFSVGEVKPHFQCSKADGQDHVRNYISDLVSKNFGIIALIQFEFTLPQPKGYTAFGASCTTSHSDPVTVLVNANMFDIVTGFRETVVGDYSKMPFLTSGKAPSSGSMCVADPTTSGERGYAGAVVKHKASGQTMCVVSGTFPHCRGKWEPQFICDIEQNCNGSPLLIIADTNAACETEGPAASKKESMQAIGEYHNANWGTCSDPAIASSEPTCCHDLTQGHPEARYWYDRTALCGGGGSVDQFQVNDGWVCGVNEEHKYTTAVVTLETSLEMHSENVVMM